MSKGDSRRPGKGYADNWDTIFKKPEPKQEPCAHYWVDIAECAESETTESECAKCGKLATFWGGSKQLQARPDDRQKLKGDR